MAMLANILLPSAVYIATHPLITTNRRSPLEAMASTGALVGMLLNTVLQSAERYNLPISSKTNTPPDVSTKDIKELPTLCRAFIWQRRNLPSL